MKTGNAVRKEFYTVEKAVEEMGLRPIWGWEWGWKMGKGVGLPFYTLNLFRFKQLVKLCV